ncbi:hypothetical protein GLOTRDRAFT_131691 [Gloeophyllum trabeum ATCC 11539]|uniref:F-box domain-containing protein n=1 Tax=Gloeophyllum trabeum (strain ATCC 11539 / FP-39264 / Madison 617) TaxID=670483 RepID=S7RE24_GLOTA|nr:uncharacterized protein GLOTRDRAFT_131691 [Gloeophyllum trabeum ATCC 11539]EPQ52450.1 hypothetical protein GLOTRDRAFT_131691 [Gloeophyllum trabeum ATCC 11539]
MDEPERFILLTTDKLTHRVPLADESDNTENWHKFFHIMDHTSDLTFLSLHLPDSMWPDVCRQHAQWTFPRLEHLEVHGENMVEASVRDDDDGYDNSTPFIAPGLKHLRSENFNISIIDNLLTPRLEILEISSNADFYVDTVLSTLKRMPNLKELHLWLDIQFRPDDKDPTEVVHFHQLQTLDLHINNSAEGKVFSLLSYPRTAYTTAYLHLWDHANLAKTMRSVSTKINQIVDGGDFRHCTVHHEGSRKTHATFSSLTQLHNRRSGQGPAEPKLEVLLDDYPPDTEALVLANMMDSFSLAFGLVEHLELRDLKPCDKDGGNDWADESTSFPEGLFVTAGGNPADPYQILKLGHAFPSLKALHLDGIRFRRRWPDDYANHASFLHILQKATVRALHEPDPHLTHLTITNAVNLVEVDAANSLNRMAAGMIWDEQERFENCTREYVEEVVEQQGRMSEEEVDWMRLWLESRHSESHSQFEFDSESESESE